MKKCLLIINPYSGKLKMQNELMNVIKILNSNNYQVQVEITLKHNHAKELAFTAEGVDLIICSGGDGTLNQVVNGVISAGKNIPIGYIPSGSTNDFANTLGISSDIQTATINIINGNILNLDVGKFDETYFTYVAAFGMLADISYSTPQPVKNKLGHMAYVISGLNNLANIRPYSLKVKSKEFEAEGEYLMGMVMNTTSVGGVLKLNEVDLADGLFEVLLIKKPVDLVDLNEIFGKLIVGDFSSRMFNYFKTSELEIEFLNEENSVWSLDGEEQKAGNIVKIINLNKKMMLKK